MRPEVKGKRSMQETKTTETKPTRHVLVWTLVALLLGIIIGFVVGPVFWG